MNLSNQNQGAAQAVGIGAMVFAVVAALAIGSLDRKSTDHASGADWLQLVETAGDHIEPQALTRELLAAPTDVVLVDVRPPDEFAAFHLPGAHNLTVPEVCGEAGAKLFATNPRLVVLYSNGPTHPGQAWVELHKQGRTNVQVLGGGLDDWKAQVLTPPSLREGATEAGSKAALTSWTLQSAFFLGKRQPNPLAAWATDPAQLTQPTAVSTQWLHDRLGAVAVLDVRKPEEFAALHLPGAQLLDLSKLRSKTDDRELFLLPPEALARHFGSLGVTNTTPVVLYADEKMQDATLAAVALLSIGHQALAILEGGVLRWATEQRTLVAETTAAKAANYVVRPPAEPFAIPIDDLAKAVQDGTTAVLDVRPPEFFRGDKSTEARPGHIPGAKNRPFQQDLLRSADGQWFRPRSELAKEYAALGLAKDQPVTVHCRTGHTASESYFVLRYLLGYEKVRWFNGSWTEWAARKDLPAVTGAQ